MSSSGGGFATTLNLRGTTTNDNAAAGIVGEYIVATIAAGSAVALTTATAATVTSISLTAGDWDASGVVEFTLTGATTTHFAASSNTAGATMGALGTAIDDARILTTITDTHGLVIPVQRWSLAGTTTVFLIAQATFSAGTVAAYGRIRARRVR